MIEDDDDDASAHAADDPTAMWDEESLAALGLGRPSTESATGSAPATAAKSGPSSSVEVSLGTAADPRQGRVGHATPASRGGGLSWSVTILLALVLAVSVYLAIRYLR